MVILQAVGKAGWRQLEGSASVGANASKRRIFARGPASTNPSATLCTCCAPSGVLETQEGRSGDDHGGTGRKRGWRNSCGTLEKNTSGGQREGAQNHRRLWLKGTLEVIWFNPYNFQIRKLRLRWTEGLVQGHTLVSGNVGIWTEVP